MSLQNELYRKCSSCDYKGEAILFKQKTEIASTSDVGVCMNTQWHCPSCNSTDISGYFQDAQCSVDANEPEPIIIDQPKQKKRKNQVGQIMHYKDGVSIKGIRNRKIYVTDMEAENTDDIEPGIQITFLRADLTKERLDKLPAEKKLKGKVIVEAFGLSDIGGLSLLAALHTYYTQHRGFRIQIVPT